MTSDIKAYDRRHSVAKSLGEMRATIKFQQICRLTLCYRVLQYCSAGWVADTGELKYRNTEYLEIARLLAGKEKICQSWQHFYEI